MNKLQTVTPVLGLTAGVAQAEMHFNCVASFTWSMNMADGVDKASETSAEIIAPAADGMTLVYTDSPLGAGGLTNLSYPKAFAPLGNVSLDGEPTSFVTIRAAPSSA